MALDSRQQKIRTRNYSNYSTQCTRQIYNTETVPSTQNTIHSIQNIHRTQYKKNPHLLAPEPETIDPKL